MGRIELTGEDNNGQMWAATIYGPNTADPVVKGDAARVRRLGRDAFAEVAHTGRTDDHVAALGEWQTAARSGLSAMTSRRAPGCWGSKT
jgi:hypothetical protein